ncbi:hypothetical protein [Streptomyces sp. NPDC059479]|uniref:hypothetical protein n=1 Tax=Streptomyces sp. NPDC059479 TaxID=3346848 RepID=UPI0036847280
MPDGWPEGGTPGERPEGDMPDGWPEGGMPGERPEGDMSGERPEGFEGGSQGQPVSSVEGGSTVSGRPLGAVHEGTV